LMLQAAVAVALGPTLVRALAFPLAYALLLVPFGDEVVPLFQHVTAQLMMPLLALAGIPATLDGLYIAAPSGMFVVAEACSGVMFLVAMAAFAVLAANLCFRSWKRRIIFVAAALMTTIIANALRAFGTILIAENYGHDTARGFDHLVYGWVFFAVTIIAVMFVARRWFDRPANDPAINIERLVRNG
jgi:exosortase